MNAHILRPLVLTFISTFLLTGLPSAAWALRFSEKPKEHEFFNAHAFEEPLVPTGKIPASEEEDQALATSLRDYHGRSASEDISSIKNFVESHPNSRWKGSLLLNQGILQRRQGYFSKAVTSWEEAWQLLKGETELRLRALADRTAGELAEIYLLMGDMEKLEAFLNEIQGRGIRGAASERIEMAQSSLARAKAHPEKAFKCGSFALNGILAKGSPAEAFNRKLQDAQSGPEGFSLSQLWQMAQGVGLDYQMAYREPGSGLITNSVIHWKFNHYSALMEEKGNRCQIWDGSFGHIYGQTPWMKKAVLDTEASGYFLVPKGKLPQGWRQVALEEGSRVFGKHTPQNSDPKAPTKHKECEENGGMARASFNLSLTGLNIVDTPIFYTPPRGESISFRVSYNQRDIFQPAVFTYANLGSKWTFDGVSYLTDDPGNTNADVSLYLPGGGVYAYSGFATNTQSAPELTSRGILTRVSTNSYELSQSDGSKEVFGQSDGSSSPGRKIFLTKRIDPQGNTNSFAYDGDLRMTSIIDALNQTNALVYVSNASTNAFYRTIKNFNDPFGRSATFDYDSLGRLIKITDMIGLTSQFTYDGSTDFIKAMTTPYGATTFVKNDVNAQVRSLEITDPLGRKERVETHLDEVSEIAASDSAGMVPTGLNTHNELLNIRNTFYWDKKLMQDSPRVFTNAYLYHWLYTPLFNETTYILESEKKPLENRIWYNYQGQSNSMAVTVGMSGQPSKVARVLDDGSTQLYQNEYNLRDQVTKEVDPIGRTTIYIYDTNNIDRVETRQVFQNPEGTTNVLSKATYNAQHRSLTLIDVAGQTNSFTYNSRGQILTSANPKNETITYAYDGSGYLTNITGAIAGAVTSYTYDNFGRTYAVADSEGYTITNNYDSLNRLTRVSYPDGTFVTNVYDKLDLVLTKDRLGRSARKFYDSAQQLVAMQDAENRTINYEWCGCGSLEKILDPVGNATAWIRDIRSRVTSKIYPDGTVMQYSYDSAGRLLSSKDAKNQYIIYKYLLDNNIQQISYSNAVISTPSVSYTYDTNFNRIATMIDGVGTNAYAYNDITSTPTLGAGRLASVDGPFANDTVTYSYDGLGRINSRVINISTNSVIYDALGRITTMVNPLGTFSNSYVNATARLSRMTYPNGMILTNTYFGNTNDQRLSEMKYWDSTNGVISKFNYEYNAEGQITKWTQQTNSAAANFYNLGYDNVDQLTSADLNSGASTLKRYVYRYDKAGNRTSEQIDTNVTTAVFNNLNQLTNLTSTSGPVRFKGSVNEPATVTLSNASGTVSASVASNGNFNASFTLSSGTNTVSIIAIDYSGNTNTSTNRYQIVMPPAFSTALAYDANGNMITNGVTTFSWDAANRLVGVSTSGVQIASFTYDGLSRRTRMVSGSTTNQFVWCGNGLCEERDASGGTVQKRYFLQGTQYGTTNLFYAFDHLASIREIVDDSGTIRSRYDYDLYGRRTKIFGDLDVDFGFTGYFFHQPSDLHLALYRAYDANIGRWLSRDPLAENEGLNLYKYVNNNPPVKRDLRGDKVELCYETWLGNYAPWHVFIVVNKIPYGFHPGGAFFFNTKGQVWLDWDSYNDSRVLCAEVSKKPCCSQKEFDNLVSEAANSIEGSYKFIGRNCSDWVAEVIGYAKKNCKKK